jgi:hypothetical protein
VVYKKNPRSKEFELLAETKSTKYVLSTEETREVPNCGLKVINNDRRGRLLKIPNLKGKQSVSTLREQSFLVHCPQLFNSLPIIRNLTKISNRSVQRKD